MTQTYGQSWQDILEAAIKNLGLEENNTLLEVFQRLGKEVDEPLLPHASFPAADAKLNFNPSYFQIANTSWRVVSEVGGSIYNIPLSWVNLQDKSVSDAQYFDLTGWPVTNTVGKFRRIGFGLDSAGKIKLVFSPEETNEVDLVNPGLVKISGGVNKGFIDVVCTNTLGYFKTIGSTTNIIENSKIFRYKPDGNFNGWGSLNSQLVAKNTDFTEVVISNFTINENSSLLVQVDGIEMRDGNGWSRNVGSNSIVFDSTILADSDSPVNIFVGQH